MRKYETFFIVDPDLPDDTNNAIDDKIKSVVDSNGGNIITYASWGKKKLAYPVRKRSRGNYILMEYSGGPELVAELERNMRLDERVLKFITVKQEDRFDPEKEEARKPPAPPAFGEDEDTLQRPDKASSEYEEEGMEEGFGEESQEEE